MTTKRRGERDKSREDEGKKRKSNVRICQMSQVTSTNAFQGLRHRVSAEALKLVGSKPIKTNNDRGRETEEPKALVHGRILVDWED